MRSTNAPQQRASLTTGWRDRKWPKIWGTSSSTGGAARYRDMGRHRGARRHCLHCDVRDGRDRPDRKYALSRNEVLQTPSGERTWRGTFEPLGQPLHGPRYGGSVPRPGRQARGSGARWRRPSRPRRDIPIAGNAAEAVRMQIYQMRWTTNGRHRAVLGPYRSWPFGYVMDPNATRCGSRSDRAFRNVSARERRWRLVLCRDANWISLLEPVPLPGKVGTQVGLHCFSGNNLGSR